MLQKIYFIARPSDIPVKIMPRTTHTVRLLNGDSSRTMK